MVDTAPATPAPPRVKILDAYEANIAATEGYAALVAERQRAYEALPDGPAKEDAAEDLRGMAVALERMAVAIVASREAWQAAAQVELSTGIDAAIAAFRASKRA